MFSCKNGATSCLLDIALASAACAIYPHTGTSLWDNLLSFCGQGGPPHSLVHCCGWQTCWVCTPARMVPLHAFWTLLWLPLSVSVSCVLGGDSVWLLWAGLFSSCSGAVAVSQFACSTGLFVRCSVLANVDVVWLLHGIFWSLF